MSTQYNFFMINKVVGYSGFKSYAEQPYPTKKQGKQLQQTNQIWASTRRQADKVSTLDNFNHYHTLYKKTHVENTEPKDYHPEHVVRGANSTINFKSSSVSKPYDKDEANKAGEPDYRKGINMLQTGTEHWKSNYQAEIGTGIVNKTLTATNNQGSKFSTMRSQSTGKAFNKNLIDENQAKANSYKFRPYINEAPTGTTDYKFNYGQKIGSSPLELLSREGTGPTLRDHPLKHGTNQLWTQIPGYQGFKPSEVPFQELKSKIEARKQTDKGDKKLNLAENYNVNIPGYAGFKPKYDINTEKLRGSCFDFKLK